VPRWRPRATVLEQLVALLLVAVFRAAFGDFAPRRSGNFLDRNFCGEDFGGRPLDTGPALLLDLDYRTQIGQSADPTTATGLYPGRTATEGWHCDEAAGNLVGEIAANALVPANSPLQGRTAVGLWNGANLYSRKCVELKDLGSARFAHASSAFFPLGTASYGISFDVRLTRAPTATTPIIAKFDAGGGLGFRISALGNGVRFTVGDGTTQLLDSAGTLAIGVWTRFVCIVDRDSGLVKIFSGHAAVASTALTKTGTHANAKFFTIGDDTFSSSGPAQVRNVWLYEGAEIEGFTQGELDTSWQHGKQATTPALTTYTRASVAGPVVGDETGFGLRVAKYGAGQFAMLYRPGFTHASKLGMLAEKAITNLCPRSEDFANWTLAGTGPMALVANDAEAPDGTQTADKLTAGANDDYAESPTFSLSSGARYNGSLFIRRVGGGDVAGRLVVWDVTAAAERDAIAFVATSEWTRVDGWNSIVPTGTTNHTLRVEIDTAGEAIYAWGAQVEAAVTSQQRATSYVPTGSTSVVRAAVIASLTNTEQYMKGAKGEIEITISCNWETQVGGDRYLYSVRNAGDDNNAHRTRLDSAERYNVQVFDNVATLFGSLLSAAGQTSHDEELTLRERWNADADVSPPDAANLDMFVNGTRDTSDYDSGWTDGAGPTNIYLGNHVGGNHIEGGVARLRIWDAPRKDVP